MRSEKTRLVDAVEPVGKKVSATYIRNAPKIWVYKQ